MSRRVPSVGFGPTSTPAERAAQYERDRLKHRVQVANAEPYESASDVRDELLKAIAPGDGVFYDPAALALVERFEAALRRDWDQSERMAVADRCRDAVRGALLDICDGRLL
jgi:hypothetical protein